MTLPEQMHALDQKVNYIGLIFVKGSPRNAISLDPTHIPESSPRKVAVFVNTTPEEVALTAKKYNINIIQLHGNETPRECENLRKLGFEVWKAFPISNTSDFIPISEYADVINRSVLDTKTAIGGGSGKKFDWHLLSNYKYSIPFMLAGGISPEDVDNLKTIKHPALIGYDLNSRFELSPGNKNISLIEKFIKNFNRNT